MKIKLLATILVALSGLDTHADTMSIMIPHPIPTESEQRDMAMHSFCVSTTTVMYKFNDMSTREHDGWKRISLDDGGASVPNYVGTWKAYLPEGKEVMAVIDGKTIMVPMKVAHPCYIKMNGSE